MSTRDDVVEKPVNVAPVSLYGAIKKCKNIQNPKLFLKQDYEKLSSRGMPHKETIVNLGKQTLRMKNRRMRWSVNGANNLAKALYEKEMTEYYISKQQER